MRGICLGLAATVLAGACAGPPDTAATDQPVVGAEVDTGDPGVVALLTGTGFVFCTGTLVSPRVVLTAAHCIAEAGGPSFTAFFGDHAPSGGRQVGVTSYQRHVGWTGEIAGGHDIAVLLLDDAQPLDLVVPMNHTDLATMVGADYRVAGFGINDRTTRDLDGYKRTGHMKISGFDGDYVTVEDVDADQATAICQGDSGGPGFITLDGVEYLAGIHTYSIQGCFNPSGDSRPDLYLTSFIQPFIDANDTTCRADGQCVRVGCSADPDCEPCGPDGTCATTACPLPDPDCPTGALGDICQADSQCMSGQCVAWPGDPQHTHYCSQPCTGPADCPTAGMTCGSLAGEGTVCVYAGEPPGALGQACDQATDCAAYVCADGVCTYPCDLPHGLLCPVDYACATHDSGATYNCFPKATPGDDDGGCCASARGAGGPGALALGAAVAAIIGRRRRGAAGAPRR